jgi:hypothetical protein
VIAEDSRKLAGEFVPDFFMKFSLTSPIPKKWALGTVHPEKTEVLIFIAIC